MTFPCKTFRFESLFLPQASENGLTIMAVQDNSTYHVLVLKTCLDLATLDGLDSDLLALQCDVSLHFVGQDGTIQAGILQTDVGLRTVSRCWSCWNVLQAHLQFTMLNLNVVILFFWGDHWIWTFEKMCRGSIESSENMEQPRIGRCFHRLSLFFVPISSGSSSRLQPKLNTHLWVICLVLVLLFSSLLRLPF